MSCNDIVRVRVQTVSGVGRGEVQNRGESPFLRTWVNGVLLGVLGFIGSHHAATR